MRSLCGDPSLTWDGNTRAYYDVASLVDASTDVRLGLLIQQPVVHNLNLLSRE